MATISLENALFFLGSKTMKHEIVTIFMRSNINRCIEKSKLNNDFNIFVLTDRRHYLSLNIFLPYIFRVFCRAKRCFIKVCRELRRDWRLVYNLHWAIRIGLQSLHKLSNFGNNFFFSSTTSPSLWNTYKLELSEK